MAAKDIVGSIFGGAGGGSGGSTGANAGKWYNNIPIVSDIPVVGGIVGAIGGVFDSIFAQGGVPGGTGISAYRNSIVSSPTIFPFASGVGLMGEAGPEGILPLQRMSNGDLGVAVSAQYGYGTNEDLIDQINDWIYANEGIADRAENTADDNASAINEAVASTVDNTAAISAQAESVAASVAETAANTAATQENTGLLGSFGESIGKGVDAIGRAMGLTSSESRKSAKVGLLSGSILGPVAAMGTMATYKKVASLISGLISDPGSIGFGLYDASENVKDTFNPTRYDAYDQYGMYDFGNTGQADSSNNGRDSAANDGYGDHNEGEFGGLGPEGEGYFADGGYLGAGKWGIAGENGPEPVFGPANIMSSPDFMEMLKGKVIEIHNHITTVVDGKIIKKIVDKHIVDREQRGVTGLVSYASR